MYPQSYAPRETYPPAQSYPPPESYPPPQSYPPAEGSGAYPPTGYPTDPSPRQGFAAQSYPPQFQDEPRFQEPLYDPQEFGRPLAPEPQQQRGLRARDLHNLPAILVLLLAGGGIGYAGLFPEHWLRGVLFMAGALGLAGGFRLVLPARQAGWLAVRGRIVDVISYVGTGGALWVVGLLLPPTRT